MEKLARVHQIEFECLPFDDSLSVVTHLCIVGIVGQSMHDSLVIRDGSGLPRCLKILQKKANECLCSFLKRQAKMKSNRSEKIYKS